MAKKQTRRGVSINGAIYDLAIKRAASLGKSLSHVVSDLIVADLAAGGVAAPPVTHAAPKVVAKARKRRGARRDKRDHGAWLNDQPMDETT